MKTLSELKTELRDLTDYIRITLDPKVKAAIAIVRKEREPKVKELEAQIRAL